MELTLCIIGLGLLMVAPILCWFQHDKTLLWMGALIVGEIVAWCGAAPVLSKLFLFFYH